MGCVEYSVYTGAGGTGIEAGGGTVGSARGGIDNRYPELSDACLLSCYRADAMMTPVLSLVARLIPLRLVARPCQ